MRSLWSTDGRMFANQQWMLRMLGNQKRLWCSSKVQILISNGRARSSTIKHLNRVLFLYLEVMGININGFHKLHSLHLQTLTQSMNRASYCVTRSCPRGETTVPTSINRTPPPPFFEFKWRVFWGEGGKGGAKYERKMNFEGGCGNCFFFFFFDAR